MQEPIHEPIRKLLEEIAEISAANRLHLHGGESGYTSNVNSVYLQTPEALAVAQQHRRRSLIDHRGISAQYFFIATSTLQAWLTLIIGGTKNSLFREVSKHKVQSSGPASFIH